MLRSRVTLVVLAVIFLFLGAGAFGILRAQEHSREGLVSGFNERADFGSLFLGTLFDLSAQAQTKRAASRLGETNPDAQDLRRYVRRTSSSQQTQALLLDSKGGVLAAIPPRAGDDPELLSYRPDLALALRRGIPQTGNIIKAPGGDQMVNTAVPFETAEGRRVIAIGSDVVLFDSFMKTFLKGIPAVDGGQAYLLDANDRVLSSAGKFKVGARLNMPGLRAAIERGKSGAYKQIDNGSKRRFTSSTVPHSSLKFVLSVPEATLFGTVDDANTLAWILYAIFGFGVIAGVLGLSRAHKRNRELELAEQRQRAQAELAREEKRADREAERLKSEFFAIVSHELRTPLTSIMGYVDLLRERDQDNLSDDGKGRLDVVHRNAGRLDRLVQDLLMLTQLEAGTFGIEPGEVNVCELARNSEPEAALMADLADIEFSMECRETIPVFWGDPQRLAQVLDNLISNALKFTPKGGRVAVSIAADRGRCVFEVSDTGVGIEEKDKPRLFNRFYRGEIVPPGKVAGAGLGLAIIQAIVDSHGGEVAVESEVGKGSTFRVFIPMTPVPGDRPSRERPHGGRQHSPDNAGAGQAVR